MTPDQTKSKIARDDARYCSGYFGVCAIGADLTHQRERLWAHHDRCTPMIERVFWACDHGERPQAQAIDEACQAFDTQLQVMQAALYDGFESLASFVHHDKVDAHVPVDEEGLD